MLPENKLIGYRPTWAQIDLGNLAHNFKEVKKMVSPDTKVLVTVKADAYGHGMLPVASKLAQLGVDWFGVASIDEGIRLRNAGIKKPILILGLILEKDSAPVFTYRLTPTVCDYRLALALDKKARSLGKKLDIHLKVDTGMGRIGVWHAQALSLAEKIVKLKNLRVQGVFTHLSCADSDQKFTRRQVLLVRSLVDGLAAQGIRIPLVHAANSMGVAGYRESHFTMVRPGLIIYGLYPKKGMRIDLKPVLSLKTEVIYTKKVPAGTPLSYGATYRTKQPATIATLPIGYGDGYPRNLSNKAPVLIKGRRYRISGRICMDQIMVDAGRAPVRKGDEVVLIGRQGRNTIAAEELAALSGTISYEIVCGLGNRIPRVYVR